MRTIAEVQAVIERLKARKIPLKMPPSMKYLENGDNWDKNLRCDLYCNSLNNLLKSKISLQKGIVDLMASCEEKDLYNGKTLKIKLSEDGKNLIPYVHNHNMIENHITMYPYTGAVNMLDTEGKTRLEITSGKIVMGGYELYNLFGFEDFEYKSRHDNFYNVIDDFKFKRANEKQGIAVLWKGIGKAIKFTAHNIEMIPSWDDNIYNVATMFNIENEKCTVFCDYHKFLEKCIKFNINPEEFLKTKGWDTNAVVIPAQNGTWILDPKEKYRFYDDNTKLHHNLDMADPIQDGEDYATIKARLCYVIEEDNFVDFNSTKKATIYWTLNNGVETAVIVDTNVNVGDNVKLHICSGLFLNRFLDAGLNNEDYYEVDRIEKDFMWVKGCEVKIPNNLVYNVVGHVPQHQWEQIKMLDNKEMSDTYTYDEKTFEIDFDLLKYLPKL